MAHLTQNTQTRTHTYIYTYITYTHTQDLNVCAYIYNIMLRRGREMYFYICYFSTTHCALWLESILLSYEVQNRWSFKQQPHAF